MNIRMPLADLTDDEKAVVFECLKCVAKGDVIEGGNHVCNNMPFRYRPAIWDFLAKHLGAATSG